MALFKRQPAVTVAELGRWHKFSRLTLAISLGLLVLMVAIPAWKLSPLMDKEAIPLHYNVLFGVDLLGPWYQVFYLPILGALVLAANLSFERLVYAREKILSTFFLSATLIVETALFVAVVLIVLLNL